MWVVIDTETTGIDPDQDAILEVAALRGDGQLYQSYCHFEGTIPPEAKAVHHIPEEAVRYAPPLAQVMAELSDFVGGLMPVAHNAPFDKAFLANAGFMRRDWIDTLQCARHLFPDAPAYGNQVLRYYLDLQPEPELIADLAPHRAQYDVAVTMKLLQRQLEFGSTSYLLGLSGKPALLKKVNFGKHKGKLWSEVDAGYLRWCLSQADMDWNVQFTANHWAAQRRKDRF